MVNFLSDGVSFKIIVFGKKYLLFLYKRTNLKGLPLYILLFSFNLISLNLNAQQKIGLVLSGGGANGFAHIGVLKALEENEIPIDYITGTSAGAFIGSMYAAGYSPEEMEAYVMSDDFKITTSGKLHPTQEFLFREDDENAGIVNFSLAQNNLLKKSLPTNFTSSTLMDYEMMLKLGVVSASTGDNFDSLFVPFRCVASDIANKKTVIFKDGHLNEAVRASMTYPFYYKPLRIDSILLFDGGLYNNFPADVMYTDFNPDFIIGSNVSYNAAPPDEDDIISQLTNMLVSYSDFSIPCEEGILIEPKTEISTFNFSDAKQAIEDGYQSALLLIDSLKLHVVGRISKEELTKRRTEFRKQFVPIKISSVSSTSKNDKMKYATRSILKRKKAELLDEKKLAKRYFRLNSSSQIDFIFPTLQLKQDSSYNLNLNIRKAKEIKVEVGGHFSSRPVNTGYIGLSYQSSGKVFTKTKVESYFGKFYGSAKGKFTLELPTVYPISTSVYFTMNRWDYFRSFATFFEEVKPSFLIQNEMYLGLSIDNPIGNTITSEIDGRWFELEDNYYQTDNFTNKDTSDLTRFYGFTGSWSLTQNTLNRKQFANSGHFVKLKARYVYGREHSVPGSTGLSDERYKYHSWFNIKLDYQSFIVDQPFFHLGLHGQVVYNTHPLFANYTATLLSMNEFSVVPDSKTYFLPEYRAPQFAGGGLNLIFTIRKKFDLRFDAYIYQPFVQINENPDGTQELSKLFQGRTYIASSSLIYNSFIGPIRLTLNYFPEQTQPLALQFSLGYVIFNERAVR